MSKDEKSKSWNSKSQDGGTQRKQPSEWRPRLEERTEVGNAKERSVTDSAFEMALQQGKDKNDKKT